MKLTLLAVVFSFCWMAIGVHSYDGKCGDHITWTLKEGCLLINGTGRMYDFRGGITDSRPWSSFYDLVERIVVVEGVTHIGDYAFYGIDGLNVSDIILPSTLKSIGKYAFCHFVVVEDLSFLPEGLESIGDYAFSFCNSLANVVIPEGVTTIGYNVFYTSYSLTRVALSSTVARIDPGDFCSDCPLLTSIDVSDKNPNFKSIDGVLFTRECDTLIRYPPGLTNTTYSIPSSVKAIGDYAFSDSKYLTEVSVPSSVESIGNYSFQGCRGINPGATLGHVKSIGNGAFSSCDFPDSITIPASVTWMAFDFLDRFESFVFEEGNEYYKLINGTLYNPDGTTLIRFSKKPITEPFVIPPSVINIGDSAFSGYSQKSITFSSNLKTIGQGAFAGCSFTSVSLPEGLISIGASAFQSCSGLVSVYIPDSVNFIGDSAFEETGLVSVSIPDSVSFIGDSAFSETGLVEVKLPSNLESLGNLVFLLCQDLKSVSFPAHLTSIGNQTFADTVLETVTLPDSVESLGNGAFEGCDRLTSITLSRNLITIGDNAFESCSRLTSITIPANVTSIGREVFKYCPELSSINVEKSNTKYKSIDGVLFDFESKTLIAYPIGKTDTKYTVPSGITSIADCAFYQCQALEDVFIYDGLTSIGASAFAECSNLKQIHLPDSVTSIGNGAFYSCSELENMTLPSKLISIGDSTFCLCSKWKMSSLNIPSGVESIGKYAFYMCRELLSVYIPSSVKSIGSNAFSTCVFLENVTISNGVKIIEPSAFDTCVTLTTIVIPESVTLIGNMAFSGCKQLSSVFLIGSQEISGDCFSQCVNLTQICVPPDYKSSTCGGKNTTSDLPDCQHFQSMFSHCFNPVYDSESGMLIEEKSKNASEWENQSNGCIKYACDNTSGKLSWSLCNSSETSHKLCMNDECNDKDALMDGKITIEIDIEATETDEVNIYDIERQIELLSGIDGREFTIALEADEHGKIIRVIIFIDDAEKATRIAEALDSIGNVSGCSYGILCRIKTIHLNGTAELSYGIVTKNDIVLMVIFITALLMLLHS